METLAIIAELLEAVGLMALLSIAFGRIERSGFREGLKSILFGLLFGISATVTMLSPVQLAPGIIIDGRSILVGMGAAFGGWLSGAIAAIIAVGYRLHLGGSGAEAGALGICLAALLGFTWAKICRCDSRPSTLQLAIAGTFISLQFVSVILLPWPVATGLVAEVYPWLLIASVSGAIVLGKMVQRERGLYQTMTLLKKASEFDVLTDLPNRRFFQEHVPQIAGKKPRPGRNHFIILLDIDHFKSINDKWGHDAGDAALVAFAKVLRGTCRDDDIVVRLGGEEFTVFVADTTLEVVRNLTERILRATRSISVKTANGTFGFTTSAGIASFEVGEAPVSDVLIRADQALYQAKRAGRDQMQLQPEAA